MMLMILLVSCVVKVWCDQNSCVVYSVIVGVVVVAGFWLCCVEVRLGSDVDVWSLSSCRS